MKQLDYAIQKVRFRKVMPYLKPNFAILDIGSVDGALYPNLDNPAYYCGIDPLVEKEVRKERFQLVRGFFPADLSGPLRFDAIVLLAVLEHIPLEKQKTFAADCFAYLKSGGLLLITVPSPKVDYILAVLKALRVIDGMSLEEHFGFNVRDTEPLFQAAGFQLLRHRRFQFGLNNLYVFSKP